jgi:hypothetical protein
VRPVAKFSLVLMVLNLLAIVGVFVQRSQLNDLRVRSNEFLERKRMLSEEQAREPTPSDAQEESANLSRSSELLRLRNQVSQLNARLRELGSVIQEHGQLRGDLLKRATNSFIRRSEAQRVGYNTPSDTIQTFLWALQQRDLEAVLQCFTPEAADGVRQAAGQGGRSPDDFFREAQAIIGLTVTRQDTLSDGSVQIEAAAPGIEHSLPLRLNNIAGQWKLASPP